MTGTAGYRIAYGREHAPRLGVVANSNGVFSEQGKARGERVMRAHFERLKAEGAIAADSVFHDRRIFGWHEAVTVADEFARAMVDVVLIFNSSFPNGYVLPVIAMDPHLRGVPVIVAGGEEPNRPLHTSEWATNAICGNDMNNYVAKYLDRHVRILDGDPESPAFGDELRMLLNAFHVVKALRREYHGRFGDAPGGFHSATGDQLLFFKTFGVIVETVDLLRVKEVYDRGEATGPKGTERFTGADVEATVHEMREGRLDLIENPRMLEQGARLYHALRAIIRAEGFSSASMKCWPELGGESLPPFACLTLGWTLSKGDVTAFACEGDWPVAVVQSMATRLSGRPAACLDFVGGSAGPVVQLGHCGVGIGCCMEPTDPRILARAAKEGVAGLKAKVLAGEVKVTDALMEHTVRRQGGASVGPTHIGQFAYGPKTGATILKTVDGRLKMLVFTGESSPETAQGLLYSASDVQVRDPRRLGQLRRQHGFPHHLAVAMGDISRELRELCDFYGIEYVSPDEQGGTAR